MKLFLGLAPAALLLLLLGSATVDAFKTLQAKIPNGANVNNPCQAGTQWPGVGHWNKDGGGERNPFGIAFKSNGFVWNSTICQLDSDQDGRSNGEELGDPQCVWTEGGTPERTDGITHPGICEPVNSENCMRLNGNNIPCGSTTIKSAFGLLYVMLLANILVR
uniref:Temptin n=1 Tax=Macrostomum lignano TaxID=282301 RepID=A0A1I8G570_9PLAT